MTENIEMIILYFGLVVGGIIVAKTTGNLMKIKHIPKRMYYYLVPSVVYIISIWLVPNENFSHAYKNNGGVITFGLIALLVMIVGLNGWLKRKELGNIETVVKYEVSTQIHLAIFLCVYCIYSIKQIHELIPIDMYFFGYFLVQLFLGLSIEGQFSQYKKSLLDHANLKTQKTEFRIIMAVILSLFVSIAYMYMRHVPADQNSHITLLLTYFAIGLLIVLFPSIILFQFKESYTPKPANK